jgi:NADH-quinone oxidoreductase subunit K
MPSLNDYLVLSAILFAIGAAGVFLRRNLITILLSIEIMLNAVNLTFVAFGRELGAADGQIIVFFVMTVAAAEAAVGLAIVIALFRHRESLNPDSFTMGSGRDRLRRHHRVLRGLGPRGAAARRPPARVARDGRARVRLDQLG